METHVDREDELVEIFVYRDRRSIRRHRTILGRHYNCQPAGSAVSLWNFFHQHVGLFVDRIFAHAPLAQDGTESGLEIFCADRLSGRLQHLFLV